MKMFSIIVIALALAACEVNTTDNIDVSQDDIKYLKDGRTGLCFALTASRKSFSPNSSGIALANVPCNPSVLGLAR